MSHIAAPVESWARRQAQRIVLQQDGAALSATALHQQVASASRCLSSIHGVQLGDRVALLGHNTASFFVTLLAIADSGAIVCPLNWRWTPQELAQALHTISPRLLVYEPDFHQLAQQALSQLAGQRPPAAVGMEQLMQTSKAPATATSSPNNTMTARQLLPQPQLQLRRPADGAALIVFTSGTTGASKAAVLSHDALMHQSMCKLVTVGYTAGDTYLHLAPLFHIGGISSALAVLLAGGDHVFLPRYSAAAAARLIQQHQVTALIAVPTMIADLVQHQQQQHHEQQQQQSLKPPYVALVSQPRRAPVGASSSSSRAGLGGGASNTNTAQEAAAATGHGTCIAPLRSVQRLLVGAGGMTPSLQAQLFQLFPSATVWTAYGMTEGASSLTFQQLLPPPAAAAAAAAVGRGHAMAAAYVDGNDGPGSGNSSSYGDSSLAVGDRTSAPTTSSSSRSSIKDTGSLGAAGVCVGVPAPGVIIRIQQQQQQQQRRRQQQQQQQQQPQQPMEPSPGRLTTTDSSSITSSSNDQTTMGATLGEVVTSGPHVMLGYWGDAAASAQVLGPDGWFRTGDLGWLDATGRLWLAGRSKDMVKTGGENVLAAEVERVLLAQAGVAAAAVVGVPHVRLGEQVAAAIVLQPGWRWAGGEAGAAATLHAGPEVAQPPQQHPNQQQQQHVLSMGQLQQACRAAGLAGYKVPRLVVPVQQLPLNTSGKVVKALVKQQLLQESVVGQNKPVHSRL